MRHCFLYTSGILYEFGYTRICIVLGKSKLLENVCRHSKRVQEWATRCLQIRI